MVIRKSGQTHVKIPDRLWWENRTAGAYMFPLTTARLPHREYGWVNWFIKFLMLLYDFYTLWKQSRELRVYKNSPVCPHTFHAHLFLNCLKDFNETCLLSLDTLFVVILAWFHHLSLAFVENLLRGSTTTDQDSRLSDNIERHRDSKIHFDVPKDEDDEDTESEGVILLD